MAEAARYAEEGLDALKLAEQLRRGVRRNSTSLRVLVKHPQADAAGAPLPSPGAGPLPSMFEASPSLSATFASPNDALSVSSSLAGTAVPPAGGADDARQLEVELRSILDTVERVQRTWAVVQADILADNLVGLSFMRRIFESAPPGVRGLFR